MVTQMTAVSADRETSPVDRPVTVLPGVGPERTAQLGRLEIATIEDLLLHRPSRYEDRNRFCSIRDVRVGDPVTTRGTVAALGTKWFRRHERSIFEIVLDDGTAR